MKTSKEAIKRACGFCNHPQTLPINQGWWLEFCLSKNPYVYGPMPRMRTSNRYRMEEARRMGWMAWTWNDEYTQERKGITNKNTITWLINQLILKCLKSLETAKSKRIKALGQRNLNLAYLIFYIGGLEQRNGKNLMSKTSSESHIAPDEELRVQARAMASLKVYIHECRWTLLMAPGIEVWFVGLVGLLKK